MFSSKTPRDLNHDPKPYLSGTGNRHATNMSPAVWINDPRPEFDHVPHNKPNPILSVFRASGRTADDWLWALDALAAFGGWAQWEHPNNDYHVLTRASAAETDHARRVLALIVDSSKEQS